MRWFKRLALGLITLVLLVVGACFALHNQYQVPLDLLWVTLPPASLALWLLLSLGIGVVIGILTMGGHCFRLHRRLTRLRRQTSPQTASQSTHSAQSPQGTQ